MKNAIRFLSALTALHAVPAFCQDDTHISAALSESSRETDYYVIERLPSPEGTALEAVALEPAADGTLAIATLRGDIFLAKNIAAPEAREIQLSRFASGLHEPLGLSWKDGWLYVTQLPELSRLRDLDGDGRADLFETVCDDWGITGNYHEYAFGSKHDREGNIWITLTLTGSFTSEAFLRGWCIRVAPDGRLLPTVSGLRSPGGIGANVEGDMFYTDNQGTWNGSSSLKHLKIGSFQGNPVSNRWYDNVDAMGPRPPDPENNSRIEEQRKRIPTYVPPAVILPHGRLGQSPSGLTFDRSNGKFGPFAGQLFVGEQTYAQVQRIFLEKVNGVYQGAAFPFLSHFSTGVVGVYLTESGMLFAGGTKRGWGSKAPQDAGLDRVKWTGKTPFEVLEMRARPDGFELLFTAPVDMAAAADPASYQMSAWTYIFREKYGSPEVDRVTPKVLSAAVDANRTVVRLRVEGLVKGHVHELDLPGVRSATGEPLLHPNAYYTLNEIPAK